MSGSGQSIAIPDTHAGVPSPRGAARLRRGIPALLAGLLFVALTLASGCVNPNAAVTPQQDAQGRYVIHMGNALQFVPAHAKVPVGATVIWVNDGSVGHDVQSGLFTSGKSGAVLPGHNFTYTFTQAGTTEYYCFLHHSSGMTGMVTVE